MNKEVNIPVRCIKDVYDPDIKQTLFNKGKNYIIIGFYKFKDKKMCRIKLPMDFGTMRFSLSAYDSRYYSFEHYFIDMKENREIQINELINGE